jgi:hypothetical protein
MRRRDAPQFRAKRRILAALAPAVALRAARLHDHFTSPALRHFEDSLKVCDRLAFARRAYHFPSTSSLGSVLRVLQKESGSW